MININQEFIEEQVLCTLINNPSSQATNDIQEKDFIVYKDWYIKLMECKSDNSNTTMIALSKKLKIPVSEIIKKTGNYKNLSTFDEQYCYQLKQNTAERELKQIMFEEPEGNIYDTIQDKIQKLQDIPRIKKQKSDTIQNVIADYAEVLEKRRYETGYKTGIETLDKVTGGFKKGEVTIIAARPSVGKSALALQFADEISKTKKVILFSLEMTKIQVTERLFCKHTNINNNNLKSGYLTDEDWANFSIGSDIIAKRNLIVDDSVRTISDIRGEIINNSPDIVFIDYIGLLRDYTEKFKDKRLEIASMTRKLKLMSIEFGIPIVCLAQLNRAAQKALPSLSELKESGSIEEDADNVMFIHSCSEEDCERLDVMSAETKIELEKQGKYPAILILEKHRNGEKKWIRTVYKGNQFTFYEIGG